MEVPSTPVTPDQPIVPDEPITPVDPTPDREAPATPAEPPDAPPPDDPPAPQPDERSAQRQAATFSIAGERSRSLIRSSTASSTARWWIGSSPVVDVDRLVQRPADHQARRGRRRTRAGRCRTRGTPPACCRGSARPP